MTQLDSTMNEANTGDTLEGLSWSWAQGGALATVAVLGVLAGRLSTPAPDPIAPTGFVLEAGRLLASGELRNALNRQQAASTTAVPASGPSSRPVTLQLSFVDTSGAYCRTFSTGAAAGLACREGQDWVVRLLVDAPAAEAAAARGLPASVLAEVDRRIVGAALDSKAETLALERAWER